jgi:hypothetical protein
MQELHRMQCKSANILHFYLCNIEKLFVSLPKIYLKWNH